MPEPIPLKTVTQDNVTVILLLPDEYESYNHESFERLTTFIVEVVDDCQPPLVAVDMTQVTFFESALLGVLFRGWNRLMARPGGRFAVCGLSSHATSVFETTQLDRLWPICKTREEAVQILSDG